MQSAGGDLASVAQTVGRILMAPSSTVQASYSATGDSKMFGTFSDSNLAQAGSGGTICSVSTSGVPRQCTPMTSGFVMSTGLASDLSSDQALRMNRDTTTRGKGFAYNGDSKTIFDAASFTVQFTSATSGKFRIEYLFGSR